MEYAHHRLCRPIVEGLGKFRLSDSLKESQRNWIGKSKGAMVRFTVLPPAPSGGRGVDSSSEEGEIDYRLTGKSEIIGELLKRAKEMRKNPTKAEAALWKELRNSNLGYKFRQQHPIHKYIVDFVCFEKNLIIEVDGEIHQYQLDKDSERELLLQEKKGFHIIRFTNDEILNNLSEVIAKIKAQLKALPSGKVLPPAPSGGRGGDSSHKQELKSEEESTLPSGKEKDEVLPPGEDLGGDQSEETITTFTTRPDTIFGVSFMTLAPEHELVSQITTAAQKKAVKEYRAKTAKRSERERMADTKTISGVFTGAYAEHPFTKKPIPIWISDYVLAGYGTGAVMAVPAGDERDYKFAKHFEIPIPDIFDGIDISEEAYMGKENIKLINSDFLNGLTYEQAMKTVLKKLEEINQGKAQVNFRLRDAVFSRQRYWGEPFPVYYKNNVPHLISEESLPLRLPEVEKYLPTSDGQPPLGRAETWFWDEKKAKVVEVEDPKN
ncbi:MAG TPA: DUF559 domain-containing protein, partial [Flavobacteriaceae bacterium]|nr:DUF559 domain-containing protein [Flavobacteriaceae bacterium]